MNIGQKIEILFQKSEYKNYADWGRAMNLPGDWLNDMKKKDIVKTVDINKLIIFTEFNHITLEELLKNDRSIDLNEDLPDNDIKQMLNKIQIQLNEDESRFENYIINETCKEITYDAIDVLKGLIKDNL
jgi:lysyl-tRNA synthetase class II